MSVNIVTVELLRHLVAGLQYTCIQRYTCLDLARVWQAKLDNC